MSKIKYSAEDKARILANFEFLRASGIDAKSAARNAGASHTTVYRWMGEAKASAPAQNATTQHVAALTERLAELESKAENYAAHANERHAEIKTRVDALEGKMDNWIEPQTVAGIKEWRNIVDRFDALEAAQDARAVPALAEMCTALTERVQSLEHDAKDAHEAAYNVRERLSALEASDTEPTPFHAVDRTYVLVIAIMVVTVAITLVTVLL